MKSASEMREISDRNALKIEKVAERIETTAAMGCHSVFIPEGINDSAFEILFSKGYKISRVIDYMNNEVTRIEW